MPLNYWSDNPELIKALPIRQDIEVLTADDPKNNFDEQVIITSNNVIDRQLKFGWIVKEIIDTPIVNSNYVTSSRKSIIIKYC